MKVLIATDGSSDPAKVAAAAVRLANSNPITVMTAIRVPRQLVAELRAVYGEQAAPSVQADAEYITTATGGTDVSRGYPGDDALVNQYLAEQTRQRTEDMITAINEAGGSATALARETDDVAESIISEAEGYDVLMIGSHGKGMFEGLLGSVSQKVARRCKTSVMIVR